MSGLRADRLSG